MGHQGGAGHPRDMGDMRGQVVVSRILPNLSADVLTFLPSIWSVIEEWHAYLESLKHSDCTKQSKRIKYIFVAQWSLQSSNSSLIKPPCPQRRLHFPVNIILFREPSVQSVWSCSVSAAAVMLYFPTSSLFYKGRLKSSNAAQQGLKEGRAELHPSVVLGSVAVFNSN